MPAPSSADLIEIESLAVEIATAAGTLLMARFRSALDIQFKDHHGVDPVTEVDRAVEALVRDAVGRRFPAHGVLGEESGDSGPADADYIWVVDPLDGTSNFINGLPLFACSLGVLWRGAPVAGALFVPVGRRAVSGVYHARRGGGLRFNSERLPPPRPSITGPARLSAVPGGTGGVKGVRGQQFGVVRTLGSIALELAMTAEGAFRYCAFDGAHVWDVAGGAALCLEAGQAIHVRARSSRRWRPLVQFGVPAAQERPTFQSLRAWNESFTAGDPAAVPHLGLALEREQRAPAVLRRLIRREGRDG